MMMLNKVMVGLCPWLGSKVMVGWFTVYGEIKGIGLMSDAMDFVLHPDSTGEVVIL